MSSGSSNFPESNAAPAGDGVRAREFLTAMVDSLRSGEGAAADVSFVGSGNLPSVFPVSDFAAAAVGTAGAAVADLLTSARGVRPRVEVDRRLASLWFGFSIQPIDWALAASWDPIAGDYPTADGWIRLHTNAPHHRAAALSVLDVPADKEAVAAAVARWKAEELETAIVGNKGCAAAMRSVSEWTAHPQGQAVIREPLIDARATADSGDRLSFPTPERPLRGIRVLDLTRVLAGPVATRFLAGLGADVLRIDPPTWDEPGVVPDMTLGKRCARLDLRTTEGRKTFLELLARADVMVHGYRSDALDHLGLDARLRREIRPGLVDVSLDAYGWSGPWRNRRGFDSLVQMSVGIADAGMRMLERNRPTPLPVQALDHATGYLMAAAAISGLRERLETGRGFEGRTSLARVAELLLNAPVGAIAGDLGAADEADWSDHIETTDFGTARRLRSPVTIASMQLQWHRPAGKLGSSLPIW
jgi:CoA-transferase family III